MLFDALKDWLVADWGSNHSTASSSTDRRRLASTAASQGVQPKAKARVSPAPATGILVEQAADDEEPTATHSGTRSWRWSPLTIF